MLTGTPLDLTPFGPLLSRLGALLGLCKGFTMLELGIGADIVRGIGLLIWLAFFACLALALWIGKNRRNKVMGLCS